MVLWLRLRNVIFSLSEILSRPMHPSPHCVQRLVHFREKQNVVLPKPIMCAEKHWWWVAACEFCTNARSFDIVRLTSQSGGFPGSLQRGGGGGHDVRRCRHRAARGDAHALRHHGRHVLWEAGALLPHPRHVRRLTWNAILRQPGNTKAVFPQIHCCNSHKSIFTDSHKGRGSFHTLLPQLELSAPKTLSMLRWKKAVNNKDGSTSSEIKVFHFHSAPTMKWRRIPMRLVKNGGRRVGKRGGVALWLSACVSCNAAAQQHSAAAISRGGTGSRWALPLYTSTLTAFKQKEILLDLFIGLKTNQNLLYSSIPKYN